MFLSLCGLELKLKLELEQKEEAEPGDQGGSGDFIHPFLLNGNRTVILKHYFGQTLRIDPAKKQQLDFKGGHGKFARWEVEVDGEEEDCKVVKLKSTETGKYLRGVLLTMCCAQCIQ